MLGRRARISATATSADGSWLRVGQYALAAIGPIAVAAANFLLSFSMLHLGSPDAFGVFTFLFTAAMFVIAIGSALFAAPLQALFVADRAVASTIASASTAMTLLAWPVYGAIASACGLGPFAAVCYGAFGALTLMRTVGRAWSYASERPRRVTLSDLVYASVTLGAFAAAVGWGGMPAAATIFPALALGACAGCAALGRGFLALSWHSRALALRGYPAIWQGQSRWSLLSVTTNEMAANAHIYLLALLAGPATVAPIAAGALLIRPVNVVQNALAEFERARMARFLGARDKREVKRSVRLFRNTLLVVWGGTIALALAIMIARPEWIVPAGYDRAVVSLAVALWAAVWLSIVIQMPLNVLLQAAGEFRTLSHASVWGAVVSVLGVLLAIAVGKPVWTVAALVPGWIVSTAIVRRAARELRSGHLREEAA